MIDLGKKIMIVGSGGSGKSTLAKELSKVTGLPAIHLDKHFWNAGWVATPRNEWEEKHLALLSADGWIVDGNFSGTMDIRLEKADTVMFLDINRFVCVYSVLKRWMSHIGSTREDMAEGCPEKIDLEFLLWIWNYPKRNRRTILEKLKSCGKKTVILKNRGEVSGFIKQLRQAGDV